MEWVRDIIKEWDPICLFPMAPEDEYDDEIVEVYNLLKGADFSTEDVEGGIERIFTKAFGKDVFCSFALKCQCSEVAKRLQQIMHAQNWLQKIFLELGYEYKIVNEKKYLVFNNTYCKISFICEEDSFVIETADTYADASAGVLEDSDWFSIEDIKEHPERIRNIIINYYM